MRSPSSHMNGGSHYDGTHHSCERRDYAFIVLHEYGTHHSCERRDYAFIVLHEYTIISLN